MTMLYHNARFIAQWCSGTLADSCAGGTEFKSWFSPQTLLICSCSLNARLVGYVISAWRLALQKSFNKPLDKWFKYSPHDLKIPCTILVEIECSDKYNEIETMYYSCFNTLQQYYIKHFMASSNDE